MQARDYHRLHTSFSTLSTVGTFTPPNYKYDYEKTLIRQVQPGRNKDWSLILAFAFAILDLFNLNINPVIPRIKRKIPYQPSLEARKGRSLLREDPY